MGTARKMGGTPAEISNSIIWIGRSQNLFMQRLQSDYHQNTGGNPAKNYDLIFIMNHFRQNMRVVRLQFHCWSNKQPQNDNRAALQQEIVSPFFSSIVTPALPCSLDPTQHDHEHHLNATSLNSKNDCVKSRTQLNLSLHCFTVFLRSRPPLYPSETRRYSFLDRPLAVISSFILLPEYLPT